MKTNNFGGIIFATLLISSVSLGLVGCSQDPANKSPQELKKMFSEHPKTPPDLQQRINDSVRNQAQYRAKAMQNRANPVNTTTAPK